MRAGEIDVCYETKVFADAVRDTLAGARITEGVGYRGTALFTGKGGDPKLWGDKRVRQAPQYAIDYDGLIQSVLNGGGARTGYIAPWHKDWGGKMPSELPKRDIAKAKQLLAEAGFPNGFKTTIILDSGRMKEWGAAVEPVQAMLKEICIDAEILPKESTDFTTTLRAGKYELACAGAPTGQPGDVDMTLSFFYASTATAATYMYTNPKLDELIAAQSKAYPSNEVRKKIVKEILVILEEDVPVIPLYVQYYYQVAQPWVNWPNSVDTNNQNGSNNLRDVWIDKK